MNFSLATATLLATATTVSALGAKQLAPTFVPDANAFAFGLPGSLGKTLTEITIYYYTAKNY